MDGGNDIQRNRGIPSLLDGLLACVCAVGWGAAEAEGQSRRRPVYLVCLPACLPACLPDSPTTDYLNDETTNRVEPIE
eukprot:scaffold4515_cov149-Amphora_coffeaeformis.AAC.5